MLFTSRINFIIIMTKMSGTREKVGKTQCLQTCLSNPTRRGAIENRNYPIKNLRRVLGVSLEIYFSPVGHGWHLLP